VTDGWTDKIATAYHEHRPSTYIYRNYRNIKTGYHFFGSLGIFQISRGGGDVDTSDGENPRLLHIKCQPEGNTGMYSRRGETCYARFVETLIIFQ